MSGRRIASVLTTICVFLFFSLTTRADVVSDLSERLKELTDANALYEAIPERVQESFSEAGYDPSEDRLPIRTLIFSALESTLSALFDTYKGILFSGVALILLFRLLLSLSSGETALTEGLCYLSAAACGVYTFVSAESVFRDLQSVTEQCSEFLTSAVPVLTSAHTLSGNPEKGAALAAAIPFLLQMIAFLIRSVFYPLALFCFAVSLTGFYRGEVTLRPLTSAVQRFSVRGAELCSLLAVGVITLLRASASAQDGLARKSMHFALSGLLPVAGGTLSDGVEIMYSCASSFASRAGVVSVLCVAFLFLSPCLMCLFFVMIHSILSSIAQAAGVPSLQNLYGDLKDLFSILSAFSLCSVTVLCAALLILTGG